VGKCTTEFRIRLNRGQAIGTSLQKIRKSHSIPISTSTTNLSQYFHLKGARTRFVILSECPPCSVHSRTLLQATLALSLVVKGSSYSITGRRVPELIPVLGSQPAGDGSHKPGGRLPVLSARPAVTFANFKRTATNFATW